ncbi:TetR-like C-terminal domain-containing protein, partial [Micromonospora azadirachtae]
YALAAWSIVHGFATLWLAGALPPRVGDDPREAARHVIRRLVE